ncbi:MAG: deoxyribose-phosphate aldolase [Lachnospiraceae bacterium]|nr:deoxyribose-phosphate aldolase [Lachnospiraceae bacterium]
MDAKEIVRKIDHTALKPVTTWEDIEKLCREAISYGTASVCIPPSYIARVKETFGDELKICTVIGFPLGYNTKAVKLAETRDAIENGADEIDMVINIGDVKNGDIAKVEREITDIKHECGNHVLKVIVETCYLTDQEKKDLCRAVTNAGADYIKTSTGFGTGGATASDVMLFKYHIGSAVKIKAAGGINTREDMEKMIEAGADRLGSSRGVGLLAEELDNSGSISWE